MLAKSSLPAATLLLLWAATTSAQTDATRRQAAEIIHSVSPSGDTGNADSDLKKRVRDHRAEVERSMEESRERMRLQREEMARRREERAREREREELAAERERSAREREERTPSESTGAAAAGRQRAPAAAGDKKKDAPKTGLDWIRGAINGGLIGIGVGGLVGLVAAVVRKRSPTPPKPTRRPPRRPTTRPAPKRRPTPRRVS